MIERLPSICSRGWFAVALLFAVLFGLPQAARADWIFGGDTIPAGQVVENDVIIYGADVVVAGTVKGDLVAVGSTVTVNGEVEGSLVAVGRTITLNDDVGGSVYAAARTLRLGSSFYVRHNVHFVGVLLDSQRGSKIGRDLVAASVRAQIASEIGRGLNAIIALMSFNGKIGYGLDEGMQQPEPSPATAGEPPLPEHTAAKPGDVLMFVSSADRRIVGYELPLSRAGFWPGQSQDDAQDQERILPDWLVARLGEFVALLLIGALVLWLIPRWFDRWTNALGGKPLPAAGYGLLALIIFANSVAITLLLGGAILAIGLWLGSIDLWELAFLFWGAGYSALVLAFCVFALAVFFGSKLIVAYLAGRLVLDRVYARAAEYRMVILLLGLVFYIVLRSIPYLGWVIEVAVMALGLGAIWLSFRDRALGTAEPALESE